MKLNRRDTLKSIIASAGVAPFGFRLHAQDSIDTNGKLCVFVQANGGWDPTSFCDPKTNTLGEKEINNWARSNEIQQAGNIPYAPFVNNEAFFEKYYERMLVINGVDAQTNSHTVGVVHNWSGSSSEGYPTSTALFAASKGHDLTIPYLNYGGYSVTGDLIRFTRISSPRSIQNISRPSLTSNFNNHYIADADWEAIEQFTQDRMEMRLDSAQHMSTSIRQLSNYQSAFAAQGLSDFAAAITSEDYLEETERIGNYRSNLRRQAQLTILAFKTGVSVSADLFLSGFDTHENHDVRQGYMINFLTAGVDYLWEYAELHGVADRLFVVIGSDFGRTNFYNANQGKDHWPIGSYVIMEKDQPWTNRVVGKTDELHFAQPINATTLEEDGVFGTVIYPKHVHKAIRSYLGADNTAGSEKFPFNNTETLPIFSA